MSSENQNADDRPEGEVSTEDQKRAVSLTLNFCAMHQASRLYDMNNDVMTKIIGEMHNSIKKLTADGNPLYLTVAGHSFFLNRSLIHMDYTEYRGAQQLKEIWAKLKISEVVFPAETTVESLTEFATKFVEALKDEDKVVEFSRRPWGGCTARLVLGGLDDEEDQERTEEEECELAVRVFGGLLVLVAETIGQFNKDSWNTLVRIKRTLQVLVEKMENHEALLLALTRSNILRDKLASHLTNTTILSLVVGRKLNLGRKNLVSLATAALFHDMSKVGLNDQTMNNLEKIDDLKDKDRERVGLHWMNAMHQMVKNGGLREETLPRMVVAYESQLEFSRGDIYPESVVGEQRLNVFSRIISLCDQLDTMTWSRPGKPGVTPHEAMLTVLERAKGNIDPALLQIFMSTVGLYPTGSLVRLNTRELAVVVDQNPRAPEQPMIRIIADANGKPTMGTEIKLVDDDKRQVVGPEDEVGLGINTTACFLRKAPGQAAPAA